MNDRFEDGRPHGEYAPLSTPAGATGSSAAVTTAESIPVPGGAAEGAPIRVVIVDDDPFVGASLRTILEARGGVAVAAVGTRGAGAAALYEGLRPDILLLDIRMPDLSGLAAAEAVLAAHPQARIVFLTTFADDDYIVRALALGARGYLIKQDAATLEGALHAVMEGQMVLGSDVTERVTALIGRSAPSPRPPAEASSHPPVGANSQAPAEANAHPLVGASSRSPWAATSTRLPRSANDVRAEGDQEVAPTNADPLDVGRQNARETAPAKRMSPEAGGAFPAFAADLTERERDIAELIAEGLDNREIAGALYLSEGTVRNHISAILQKCGLKNRTQIAIAWWR